MGTKFAPIVVAVLALFMATGTVRAADSSPMPTAPDPTPVVTPGPTLPPHATAAAVSVEQVGCSWTVWADYSGFMYGDVLSVQVTVNGDELNTEHFTALGWVGSGRVALTQRTAAAASVDIAYAVNPMGPVDMTNEDWHVPYDFGVGANPTRVSGTIAAGACPAALSATPPPTDTLNVEAGGPGPSMLAPGLTGFLLLSFAAGCIAWYSRRRLAR